MNGASTTTQPRRQHWTGLLAATGLLSITPLGAFAQGGDNHRAFNVPYQVALLGHNASSLAFHVTEEVDDSGDSGGHHNQGIARGYDKNGVPYMFVSHNNHGGMINVVKLESRQQWQYSQGERLRSNLVRKGVDTDDTPPPIEDRVVYNIRFVGSGNNFLGSGRPLKFEHPAGMQLIDDMLVVACEGAQDWSPPRNTAIALIDVRNPTNPTHRFTLWGPQSIDGKAVQSCLCAAVMRDADGKYVIAGMYDVDNDDANYLALFKTSVTDLRELTQFGNSIDNPGNITLIDTWHSSELGSESGWWEGGGSAQSFQSINFVRQEDGRLFLLCGRSTDGLPDSGNEYMYLFEAWFANGQFQLDYIDRHELNRKYAHSGQYADFGAAGGVTVTPRGELLVYGAAHYNQGPGNNGSNSQRFGEYFYAWLKYDNSAQPSDAYVALYEDHSGWLEQNSRYVVCDGMDRTGEDYWNLNLHEDFDNRAKSLVFMAPVGTYVKFYDRANRGGKSKTVQGTGSVITWPNLEAIRWDDGATSLQADGIECVEFLGQVPSIIMVPEHLGFGSPIHAEAALTGNPASVISIRAGSYPGQMLFDRPVTLRSRSGNATLGQQ